VFIGIGIPSILPSKNESLKAGGKDSSVPQKTEYAMLSDSDWS
jgi:hypothetical protein